MENKKQVLVNTILVLRAKNELKDGKTPSQIGAEFIKVQEVLDKVSDEDLEKIISICSVKRGVHKASWKSSVKMSAKTAHKATKVTNGYCRLGINYVNIKKVKEAGLGGGPLPGKEAFWIVFPYVYVDNNSIKVRLTYAQKLKNSLVPTKEYFLNGDKISKESLMNYTESEQLKNGTVKVYNIVQPSYWAPKLNDEPVFSVKLENLLSISGEVIAE